MLRSELPACSANLISPLASAFRFIKVFYSSVSVARFRVNLVCKIFLAFSFLGLCQVFQNLHSGSFVVLFGGCRNPVKTQS